MREILRITKESSWGTYAAGGGVKNTDFIVIELMGSNSYTLRKKPIHKQIRTASSGNLLAKNFSSQYELAGGLTTYFYPEQAQFIMNWVQDISGGDLISCTVDHYIQKEDSSGTVTYTRDLGVKVEDFDLTADSDNTPVKVTFQLRGKNTAVITSSDFAVPAQSVFPAGTPYLFTHLASPGVMTLGSARSNFKSHEWKVSNILDHPFFEAASIGKLKWCGRNVTFTENLLYVSATDRATYEATTATACSFALSNGVNSVTVDLKNANFLANLEDDLALDKVYMQSLQWVNSYDVGSTADMAVTVV